jgi:hypothetical protein
LYVTFFAKSEAFSSFDVFGRNVNSLFYRIRRQERGNYRIYPLLREGHCFMEDLKSGVQHLSFKLRDHQEKGPHMFIQV